MRKIVAIVEARMSSTRPCKPLMQAAGYPMLGHLFNRLMAVPSLDSIVLATTSNPLDNQLVDFAEGLGLQSFRGDDIDVMKRVVEAAEAANADIVVEITGDCPLIDPQIVEQTIRMFLSHDVDYVSNAIIRCYPDGMDTQVYNLDTLKKSALMTNDLLDREHVTRHIRNNTDLFSRIHLICPPELHWPELGLTLDEMPDYELIKLIIEHFLALNDPNFSCLNIINFLRKKSQIS